MNPDAVDCGSTKVGTETAEYARRKLSMLITKVKAWWYKD